MESWPAFEASEGSWFTWQIDMSYLDTLDYCIQLVSTMVVGNAAIVDWGDGSVESFTQAEIMEHTGPFYHTYDSAGIYRIMLYNHYACTNVYDLVLNIQSVRDCIISIDSPITFPDESDASRRHSFVLRLTGFHHLKSVTHGLLKNVSRRGLLFGGALFTSCYELEAIPADLLDYIDPDLLAYYSTGATLCDFSYCRSITEISKNIFRRAELWSQVGSALQLFLGCSSLRSIPEGLFSTLTNCTDFRACFEGCHSLERIGDGAFSGCSSATNFNSAFRGCENLREIGTNVFADCTAVTTFSYCFYQCSALAYLPGDLFADCYNVTLAGGCFRECGIREIPAGLFSSFTKVHDYNGCFFGCSSLKTVPFDLFDSNTEEDVDFSSCFSTDSAITSAVPELWVKYPNAPYAHRYHCYYLCLSAANYADIPGHYAPVPPGTWKD